MPRHERPSVPSSDFRDWWSVELPGPNARSRVTQMSKDPAHYGCTDRGCTPVKKRHVARKPASRSSARSSAPWAALGVSLPLLWRIKRLHCVHPALLTAKVFQKTRPALLNWGARAQDTKSLARRSGPTKLHPPVGVERPTLLVLFAPHVGRRPARQPDEQLVVVVLLVVHKFDAGAARLLLGVGPLRLVRVVRVRVRVRVRVSCSPTPRRRSAPPARPMHCNLPSYLAT